MTEVGTSLAGRGTYIDRGRHEFGQDTHPAWEERSERRENSIVVSPKILLRTRIHIG